MFHGSKNAGQAIFADLSDEQEQVAIHLADIIYPIRDTTLAQIRFRKSN
jgi:hypothetical protein